LVQMKLDENRKRREDAKIKVDALARAEAARKEEEKRQREKKRKKEATKRQIEENKRRKREQQRERQRERERDRPRPKNKEQGQRKRALMGNGKTRTHGNGNGKRRLNGNVNGNMNGNGTRRMITTMAGKENKGMAAQREGHNHALNKGVRPKRVVNVVRKPLSAVEHGHAQNAKKPLTVKTADTVLNEEGGRAEGARKRRAAAKEKVIEYAISDYDSDFSDSDLDEEQCGKAIPLWARKGQPALKVARQKAIDPDTIFGRMDYKTCDLEILFKDFPSRTRYRQRAASGDWSKDITSWAEENEYKKNMGWI